MADRKQGVQTIKNWSEVNSAVDFDGSDVTIDLDGDRPVIGLGINLSADAEVTFFNVIGGVDHAILKADGTILSLTMTAIVPIYRFFTEFAGVRTLKIAADASQTNATVTGPQV